MLDFIDEWGRRLAAGAFVYTIIALVVTWGLAAAGLEPPPLMPPGFIKLYESAASAYDNVVQLLQQGLNPVTLFEAVAAVLNLLLALLVSLVTFLIAYVWIAVMATRALPGPYAILSPIVWALGVMAETILLIYLVKRVLEALERLRGYLPTG